MTTDNGGLVPATAQASVQTVEPSEVVGQGQKATPSTQPVGQFAFQYYNGPIPPTMIAEYNRVSPGLGERLVEQIFIEGAHRRAGDLADRAQTDRIVTAAIANDKRGSWFALVITFVFVGVACLAIVLGYPWAGVTILGADLVALASVFVVAKRVEREQSKQLPEQSRGEATPSV